MRPVRRQHETTLRLGGRLRSVILSRRYRERLICGVRRLDWRGPAAGRAAAPRSGCDDRTWMPSLLAWEPASIRHNIAQCCQALFPAAGQMRPDAGILRQRWQCKQSLEGRPARPLLVGRQVAELGELAFEGEPNDADRAVALFGDNHFGLAVVLLTALTPVFKALVEVIVGLIVAPLGLFAHQVVFVAIDEHHDVGILLD